jgi:hypothetical protein
MTKGMSEHIGSLTRMVSRGRKRQLAKTGIMTGLLILSLTNLGLTQPPGKAAQWNGFGVSSGAPLPPAERFKPRSHAEEAASANLNLDVLAKLDIEMQRHVAAKNVAGISTIIHKNGHRGYFELIGMADIEKNRLMSEDSIFRLIVLTFVIQTALVIGQKM